VLQVDKHAQKQSKGEDTKDNNPQQLNDWYATGGMDFGSVAIYTCSEGCHQCLEDVVVVQDTPEDQPKVPAGAAVRDTEDIVVDEKTTSDTADEDGYVADGMAE
jgi:hypothetical protein